MVDRFLGFITQKSLIRLHQSAIVAVSGGIDSVVLVDLMQKAGLKFGIAHCNFSLRGEESEGDQIFVSNLALKYNVPFFLSKFDTLTYATEKKISTQMAARDLRYEWFEKIRKENGYDYIAVAHHLNDSLETIILNISRGTGIAGMHGIVEKVGNIIRPMLFATREEIENYALSNNLKWREDSSNTSHKYKRNLIRNKVIPLLKEINPNLENTTQETIEKISAVEKIYAEYLQKVKEEVFKVENELVKIDLDRLLKHPEPAMILFGLVEEYGFIYADAKNILESSKQSGKRFYSQNFRLVTNRNELILSGNKESESFQLVIHEGQQVFQFSGNQYHIEVKDVQDVHLTSDADKAFLDYDKVQFPLEVRHWKEGDKCRPLGMKGFKKISDLLIDKKLSVPEKERILVITSLEEIVWVVGMRVDDRYKITESTRNVLQITCS